MRIATIGELQEFIIELQVNFGDRYSIAYYRGAYYVVEVCPHCGNWDGQIN